MAKLRLPKLNSWVTTLVLASIGLHGLVLALPMPDLVVETPETPEITDPEVIQVVTLPKLAKAAEPSESSEPLLPEPEDPLPEEPPFREAPVEEIVLADPEILDEIEPELDDFIEDEWEQEPDIEPNPVGVDEELRDEEPIELTLDQRMASLDSYSNFDGMRVGDGVAATRLGEISLQGGGWPSPFRELEQGLVAVMVPLQDCLEEPPGTSVSFIVEVGPDGMLTGDPEPLNSAGYEVLDEKALEIARNADYAAYHPAGETKAYSFAIQIEYEACIPT